MVDKRNAGAAAPQVNAPEVMMPQESRAEVDRLVDISSGVPRAVFWPSLAASAAVPAPCWLSALVRYLSMSGPSGGETEIRFEDLYQQPEGDWKETYRAEIPGTVEYQRKQEAAELAAQAAAQ